MEKQKHNNKNEKEESKMPQEKQRPGFMIYFTDWDMPRKILDADDFKAFFDAVFNYAQDGEIPSEFGNKTVQVFFDAFATKLNMDNERYQDVCRKRSEAAKKSHAQPASSENLQLQQMHANAANINTNRIPNTIPNPISKEYQNQSEYQPQYEYQNQLQYESMQMQEIDEESLPFCS